MSNSLYSYSDPRILALKKTRPGFAVEVLLTERLQKFGVNPFNTYLNTLVDVRYDDVESSRTLFDETLEWVEKEQLPNYVQGINGVFKRQFSFASKDRVAGLDLLSFEDLVVQIVRVLTSAPSVNLSKRSVKSLSFEEVHRAVKYGMPEVDINAVYITSFIEDSGERKVLHSRSLAEDLYGYLQHNEIPFYHGEHVGVFSVAYSAKDEHVHTQVTTQDISRLVIDIVPDFLI
jgi:hypothetical protein